MASEEYVVKVYRRRKDKSLAANVVKRSYKRGKAIWVGKVRFKE